MPVRRYNKVSKIKSAIPKDDFYLYLALTNSYHITGFFYENINTMVQAGCGSNYRYFDVSGGIVLPAENNHHFAYK